LGSKGTLASLPHLAQVAVKNSLGPLAAFFLESRQDLQRWLILKASFGVKFLFARSKDELVAAFFTHQSFVLIHGKSSLFDFPYRV
jgi:hypothetical protein